jgi:hypothetical protein
MADCVRETVNRGLTNIIVDDCSNIVVGECCATATGSTDCVGQLLSLFQRGTRPSVAFDVETVSSVMMLAHALKHKMLPD